MSRDPRDWQADMNIAQRLGSWMIDPGGVEDGAAFYTIEKDGIQTIIHADNMLGEDAELLGSSIQALPYWLQQAKTLKEDNARWRCKHTAAEQNYLTQSNVIAELRGRADEAISKCKESFELATAYRAQSKMYSDLAEKAEEREQKLKEAVERIAPTAWNGGEEYLRRFLADLYPLDREGEINDTEKNR